MKLDLLHNTVVHYGFYFSTCSSLEYRRSNDGVEFLLQFSFITNPKYSVELKNYEIKF